MHVTRWLKRSRFVNVDFAVISGLQRWMDLLMHISAYDINCQYRVHFDERTKRLHKAFGYLKSIPNAMFPFILFLIGKFHAAAHREGCRYKHSYNYIPGAAMTDGEALERIWAFIEAVAARTKEMLWGHRHDVLNDLYGDMNVKRVHKMREFLSNIARGC